MQWNESTLSCIVKEFAKELLEVRPDTILAMIEVML